MKMQSKLPEKGEVLGVEPEGIDANSNLYVFNLDLDPNTSEVKAVRYLSKFNKSGQLISRVVLPHKRIYQPTRDIIVEPSGEAYWLSVEEDRVVIYAVNVHKEVRPFRKFDTPDNNHRFSTSVFRIMETSRYSQLDLVRRADSMINYSWVYNTANGSPIPSGVTKPDFLNSTSYGSTVYGIPYCWGGLHGTDTSGWTWSNFGSAMSSGAFAGNVNTSNVSYSTAGLDCSGFVGAVAGIPTKQNTQMLYNSDSYAVSKVYRSTMDTLNNYSSHVLFYFGDIGSDGVSISSKEASFDYPQKAKNYSRTWAWLDANGYSLRRLNGL